MDFRNIQRGLLMRLSLEKLSRRRNLELRVVHVNVLFLVFIMNKAGQGSSITAIHSMLGVIRRGCDPVYLVKLIKELQQMDLVVITVKGRRRYVAVTAAGRICLNSVEKEMRACRVDRRQVKQ